MLSLFKWDKDDHGTIVVFSFMTAFATYIVSYTANVINNVIQWNRNRKESNN